MELKNMTDFVLEQTESLYDKNQSKLIHNMVNYAQFLKQPLKLEMFVPCDEDGNVLEQPCDVMNTDGCRDCACREYKKSKEKVLFEAFESVDTRNKDRFHVRLQKANISGSYDTIQNDFAGFYFHDSRNEKSRVKIIEDLLKFHPLELTQNAIKQLGL